MNQPQLLGTKALVIGAGTPAGRIIAVALAESAADVAVAAATIDGEEVMAVRRTKRAIVALGRRTAEYAFDTTLGQNVQVSTRQVVKEMGGLDLMVNAADAAVTVAADRMSDSEWGRALALNLSGVFFACRAALREFGDRGGSILNIIQMQPNQGATMAGVSAARAGVAGLTRALAAEFEGRGVRVNAIEVRLGAADELLARLAVFLASSECTLTGQVLRLTD
jgi:NAD(P)-dependent dehydrogenase (short-subunit alcohol dehydrogenase family)